MHVGRKLPLRFRSAAGVGADPIPPNSAKSDAGKRAVLLDVTKAMQRAG